MLAYTSGQTKDHRSMNNISIDTLSVIARQCLAVTCLQRFCQRHAISHPTLSAFTEHVWQIAQVETGNFVSWEQGCAALAVNGMGDPWPEDVCAAIPGELLAPLIRLTEHVLETGAATWYGDDLPASRRQLEAVLRLCAEHDVGVPAFVHYVQADARLRGGWGPVLSDAQVHAWRALVAA